MKQDYTPKPWQVRYDNDDPGQWYEVGPAKVEFNWNPTPQETQQIKADVALISAAPDLLEALQAFVTASAGPNEAMQQAKAAIAKALGNV
jgi:hypothetical protein